MNLEPATRPRRGVRFAPSPTGPFHVGNLRTAWISEKLARALGEPWIVRFEDIDRARVVPGAVESQLADMRALGLLPDEIVMQSERLERHFALFQRARDEGQIYACDCSRKTLQADLAGHASAPHAPPPAYTGRCRHRVDVPVASANLGWRLRASDPTGAGDILVARGAARSTADFAPSYHWACALDDYDGRYRLIVRAWDLAPAALVQREIQRRIATLEGRVDVDALPAVFHTSLVEQDSGQRLEKRTRGVTLAELEVSGVLVRSLVDAFAGSFDLHAAGSFARSLDAAGGEANRAIPLSQLEKVFRSAL